MAPVSCLSHFLKIDSMSTFSSPAWLKTVFSSLRSIESSLSVSALSKNQSAVPGMRSFKLADLCDGTLLADVAGVFGAMLEKQEPIGSS